MGNPRDPQSDVSGRGSEGPHRSGRPRGGRPQWRCCPDPERGRLAPTRPPPPAWWDMTSRCSLGRQTIVVDARRGRRSTCPRSCRIVIGHRSGGVRPTSGDTGSTAARLLREGVRDPPTSACTSYSRVVTIHTGQRVHRHLQRVPGGRARPAFATSCGKQGPVLDEARILNEALRHQRLASPRCRSRSSRKVARRREIEEAQVVSATAGTYFSRFIIQTWLR
jgi:hypothetical protein